MPNYKKMYFQLAAKVADATDILTEALQQGENFYIEDEREGTVLTLLAKKIKKEKEE